MKPGIICYILNTHAAFCIKSYLHSDLGPGISMADERMRLVRRIHPQFVNTIDIAVSLVFRHIIRPLNDKIGLI